MAKKVTGYIKLQIPAVKLHQHRQLDRLSVSTALISFSSQKNLTQEQQIRATWLFRLLSLYTLTEASALLQRLRRLQFC